ncbi:MAG: hypothetical protein ACYSW2_16920, partial [Planctomycetota bacterium]
SSESAQPLNGRISVVGRRNDILPERQYYSGLAHGAAVNDAALARNGLPGNRCACSAVRLT